MTASKYALVPLVSWMDDDARVQAELKVDDYRSTGRAMLVEAPEPGPLKLNPQAWLPRAEVRYVVPGQYFGFQVLSMPARVYRKLLADLEASA